MKINGVEIPDDELLSDYPSDAVKAVVGIMRKPDEEVNEASTTMSSAFICGNHRKV